MIEIVFWLLLILIGFTFVGFPILVIALGLALRRRYAPGDDAPSVSVLIAAYNEAGDIVDKVRNTLDQRYPGGELQVVVVDDGSTDGTAELVVAIDDPRLRVFRMRKRGGKIAALNHGVAACTGEILVFTDANAELQPDALARLVAPFSDPEVGGVCGNQLNRPGRGALAAGERLYWEYDKFLKRMESLTGSIVAADGSIYAIRRRHFETVPPGVTDDFFISTGVVRDRARLVFEESARSVEAPLERGGDHYRRRVRITHQAMQSLASRRDLMNPRRSGVYALILVGHKLLRRLAAPAILLLVPVSAMAASRGGIYVLVFAGLAVLFGAAIAGWWLRGRSGSKLLAAPYYFALGILATTTGILRFLSGRRSLMWEPVRR